MCTLGNLIHSHGLNIQMLMTYSHKLFLRVQFGYLNVSKCMDGYPTSSSNALCLIINLLCSFIYYLSSFIPYLPPQPIEKSPGFSCLLPKSLQSQ